ncbi:hypothetical protein [Chitinophaga qingshengii]|uniref:DUF3137 domain-containing protein n=1 Tax=Chitinophaga qingshengii TaxID=1569794 RepID=A0ABR7TGJ9_9BACT|nr:hypothetical protein [Chitinophaga qingshengii]MBC9929539.1 hypothetical protein [Chitinophaga qingshengii]
MNYQPSTWHFNIGNRKRAAWGVVACVFVMMALIIPGLLLNLHITIVIGVTVVAGLTSILLMVKWMWQKETLTLYHDRIESALHGVIYFTDIRKITTPWIADSAAIKLHLRKGSVAWYMTRNPRAFVQNTPEDVLAFEDFLRQLEAALGKQEKKQVRTGNDSPSPAAQLEQINQSRRHQTGLIIGISSVFLLVIAIRACAPLWREPNFKRMKAASEERFHAGKQKVDALVAQKIQQEGGAFLYTNDHAATIKLFPYIHTDNPLNIDLFQYTEANKDIAAILQNPDSVQLDIYIISGDSSIRRMRSDTASRQLFFRTYDPAQHIRPLGTPPGDTTAAENYPVFDRIWRIPLQDTSNLHHAMERSIPGINIMLSQIRLRPSFYFYMTGKVKQGMNEPAFREAIITLNQLLHQNKVDTSTFITTRI